MGGPGLHVIPHCAEMYKQSVVNLIDFFIRHSFVSLYSFFLMFSLI